MNAGAEPVSLNAALGAWQEHDAARALHPHDRAAILATRAARALVVELFSAAPRDPRDLFSACARLGQLLADAGGSPSLAATTIDGAVRAMKEASLALDDSRVPPARASVAEGYCAARVEAERRSARRAFEWPGCAVPVDGDTVAVLASHPDDDGEALADWAARVAVGASRAGVKHAIVSGQGGAKGELVAALGLVGIAVHDRLPKRTFRKFLFWR